MQQIWKWGSAVCLPCPLQARPEDVIALIQQQRAEIVQLRAEAQELRAEVEVLQADQQASNDMATEESRSKKMKM